LGTVHLIHGYLGAGKTTFARQLEQRLPAIRFTHDEWIARLYGNDPPVDQFAKLSERASKQIDAVWRRCAELGLHVVLDLNFWSRKQRDQTRSIAASIGAKPYLYCLSCPDEEAWQRIASRNLDLQNNLFIARNTYEILKDRFEPLDPDEDRIEIPQSDLRP
jgi:predicted kinase